MNPEITQNLPKKTEGKENFLKEIIKFTLTALIIVLPIKYFVAQPFIVVGPSMDPTFASGQYLIIDQLTYHFKDPKRFDVIVFKYPKDPKTFYIKRIIGLPGESLSVSDGHVTVTSSSYPKGLLLKDSFVSESHKTGESFKITLGPSEYFVMGDNRAQSSDSRLWGPLDKKFIVGRPFVRLLPFSKISVIPGKE